MSKLIIEALSLNYGKLFGYQEYLFNLLRYFKQHRSEIQADSITIACKKSDENVFNIFLPEINIVGFETRNKLHRYYILNTLSKRLSLCKDDVILFTNNYSALTKHCQYILVIHDLLYLRKKYMPNKAFRLQRKLFVPRSANIADKIISISKWVKTDIVDNFGIDANKIVPIYNFFNFSKFYEGTPTTEIRQLADGKSFFLVICSNAIHKNNITILKAFNEYRMQGGDKELIVLGTFATDLQMFIDNMPGNVKRNIHNINGISNTDLGYLYQNAYAYISASLFEGLGMPVVEAMFFGLPCIVSNIPVLREVTEELATYFNPLDYKSLAKEMLNVKKDTQKGIQQKTVMENKFNEANTSGRYIELFNSMFPCRGGYLTNCILACRFSLKGRRAA